MIDLEDFAEIETENMKKKYVEAAMKDYNMVYAVDRKGILERGKTKEEVLR